jgi:hypothetical protein
MAWYLDSYADIFALQMGGFLINISVFAFNFISRFSILVDLVQEPPIPSSPTKRLRIGFQLPFALALGSATVRPHLYKPRGNQKLCRTENVQNLEERRELRLESRRSIPLVRERWRTWDRIGVLETDS